jgi:hypothetical protein
VGAKDQYVYRKTVQENGDDDILTKQYFPRAHTHTEERRELLTGVIVVRADTNEWLLNREISR